MVVRRRFGRDAGHEKSYPWSPFSSHKVTVQIIKIRRRKKNFSFQARLQRRRSTVRLSFFVNFDSSHRGGGEIPVSDFVVSLYCLILLQSIADPLQEMAPVLGYWGIRGVSSHSRKWSRNQAYYDMNNVFISFGTFSWLNPFATYWNILEKSTTSKITATRPKKVPQFNHC